MNNSTPVNKDLILLRGLPGSGKSTLVEVLSESGKYPVTSIDSYFIVPETGEYVFRFEENHLAYKLCEENTRKYLHLGEKKVFVDNTFTMDWEMEPYFKMAAEYGYRLFVMTVEKYHNGHNIHDVSQAQLEKMASRYKVKLM